MDLFDGAGGACTTNHAATAACYSVVKELFLGLPISFGVAQDAPGARNFLARQWV
jgi:hypothetical protein